MVMNGIHHVEYVIVLRSQLLMFFKLPKPNIDNGDQTVDVMEHTVASDVIVEEQTYDSAPLESSPLVQTGARSFAVALGAGVASAIVAVVIGARRNRR